MKTKCLIVDDEPLAIEVIESHLQKLDSFTVTATCCNALEAFNILNEKSIDLMFLDIQMPGIKGTEFLKTLKSAPKVILTTAYREYALEGYELDVIDYLLKPISFERFFVSVNKFMQLNNVPGEVMLQHSEVLPDESYIYIKANKKVHKVLLCDIQYIESMKDYVTIFANERKITVKQTLGSIERMLPENSFLRIHRSYIVSLSKLEGFTNHSIEIGSEELPIGRSYRQQVFRKLNFRQFEE